MNERTNPLFKIGDLVSQEGQTGEVLNLIEEDLLSEMSPYSYLCRWKGGEAWSWERDLSPAGRAHK